jgi:thiamine pyrophosphokinase
MRVVVVASGAIEPADAAWLDTADLVIAADGGASSLERMGRAPDRLVGDLDSTDADLVERLRDRGVTIDRHPTDKDASDTELALEAAVAAGATELVLLGALGGQRLDHELANLLLLADAAFAEVDLRLVRGTTTARVLHGGSVLDLDGAPGAIVSLLPLADDAVGVTTDGLRWPLADATLHAGRSRGLSNEVVAVPASVRLREGTLLVVESSTEGATA